MPVLPNSRHERFAQELAAGKRTVVEEDKKGNTDVPIAERLQALRQKYAYPNAYPKEEIYHAERLRCAKIDLLEIGHTLTKSGDEAFDTEEERVAQARLATLQNRRLRRASSGPSSHENPDPDSHIEPRFPLLSIPAASLMLGPSKADRIVHQSGNSALDHLLCDPSYITAKSSFTSHTNSMNLLKDRYVSKYGTKPLQEQSFSNTANPAVVVRKESMPVSFDDKVGITKLIQQPDFA